MVLNGFGRLIMFNCFYLFLLSSTVLNGSVRFLRFWTVLNSSARFWTVFDSLDGLGRFLRFWTVLDGLAFVSIVYNVSGWF